jgi:hypothetical protein
MSLTSCLTILTFPPVGIVQNGGMRVGLRQVKTVRAVFLTTEFKSFHFRLKRYGSLR